MPRWPSPRSADNGIADRTPPSVSICRMVATATATVSASRPTARARFHFTESAPQAASIASAASQPSL